jgi:hypothetical protein
MADDRRARAPEAGRPSTEQDGAKDGPSPDGTHVAPDGQRVSRSGAALGRPEMEHGQYGLTRPVAEGGPLPEREVRGVHSHEIPRQRG